MAGKKLRKGKGAGDYRHSEEALMRPEVGAQARFVADRSPHQYQHSLSVAPEMRKSQGKNSAAEMGKVFGAP